MSDHETPPSGHEAGGTYGQRDVSPAAERSHFRTSQNYRGTAATEHPETDGESDRPLSSPGGQLDSGGS